MYRPKRVIHFDFQPIGMPFDARPVFAEMDKAKRRRTLALGRRLRRQLGEISLHLATRAEILRLCVENLNRHMELAINGVRSAMADGPPMKLKHMMEYSILLYVDSFLFECHAYEGLLHTFFVKTLHEVLGETPRKARGTYSNLAAQCGTVDGESWKAFLYRTRRTFIHLATPWVSIDASRGDEGIYDFLIMSENIRDFSKVSSRKFFLAVKDLNLVWGGMQRMAEVAEQHLIGRISQV